MSVLSSLRHSIDNKPQIEIEIEIETDDKNDKNLNLDSRSEPSSLVDENTCPSATARISPSSSSRRGVSASMTAWTEPPAAATAASNLLIY